MTTATLRRLLVVVLVAGALCVPATAALAQAAAPPVPPGLGVKLLQGADNLADPRAHEYIIDNLAPGTTISRQVGFSNGDAQPADLTFYACAATIDDGTFRPGDGHAANDLTSWTTFSPASATVQPGQTLPVRVTIAVPADAVAGERYAAALAEHASPPAPNGGVTSVSRVGIRIYLSVGRGGAPATAFSIDSMTARRDADGNPMVTAEVHNTGERAIDLSGRLDLTGGPSSLSAGPFAVRTVATLAPGGTGDVTVPLDGALPDGPWDARITLVSGVTSETATARLTFPIGAGTSAVPTTPVPPPSGAAAGRGRRHLGRCRPRPVRARDRRSPATPRRPSRRRHAVGPPRMTAPGPHGRFLDRRRRRVTVFLLAFLVGLPSIVAASPADAATGPVGLGAAETFAVLAGAGVTNTGLTVVNGDLGACPTTSVTGFPPGVVNPTVPAADACHAELDLTTAYAGAVARVPTTTYVVPTDLGGSTLSTGVYQSPTSFGITGTLTLDAHGDPNAVFVFQAGSTLITAASSHLSLVDGAQACNVFWQVGSSATLGVGSSLVGSVLALASITATTGAAVQGRLLARSGAVTLDSNTVTRPVCSPTVSGSLSLVQAPTAGTALVVGTAVALPVTTVTDSRTGTVRSWTVTATASDLVAGTATILAAGITLAQSGSFTSGTGTVGALGLVSASGDSVGSVYTFTPTATLAAQTHPHSGSYTGTVTQTVV